MFPNPTLDVNKNIAPLSPPSELIDYLYDNDLPDGIDMPLASISARDSVWDSHRTDTLIIQQMYALESEFERYSERITDCSGWLKFGFNEVNQTENTNIIMKLTKKKWLELKNSKERSLAVIKNKLYSIKND